MRNESERKKLRWYWYSNILTKSEDNRILNLTKPGRFGNGSYMTVCVHSNDYRITDRNNIIDMTKTIELLKEAQNTLRSVQISA